MVCFLNHIASILYERGLTCAAVYPLSYLVIVCNVTSSSICVTVALAVLLLLPAWPGDVPLRVCLVAVRGVVLTCSNVRECQGVSRNAR